MKKSVMLSLSVLLIGLFVLVAPVHAQENTASQPAGVGILIGLMGVAAIMLVGFVYFAQGRPVSEEEREDEE